MASPSFTKPAHQYGQSPGDLVSPGSVALPPDEALEDEWAGTGFTARNDESST